MNAIRSATMAAAALGAALALAACSSSGAANSASGGGSAASAPAGAAASGASAPAASAAGGSGGGAAVDVCALLPAAAAAKASSLDLTSAAAEPGGSGMYGCTYSSDGDTAADLENNPDVTVYTSASSMTLDALKSSLDAAASQDGPTVPVSGVGDKAYAGADGIIVQAGGHLVAVSGLAADLTGNHATSTALAKAVIAALG